MKQVLLNTMITMAAVNAFSQTNTDEQSLRDIVSTMETAWNEKNGQKFSSVFAEQHDYIVVDGLYFSNFSRQANAHAHQGLFDGVYRTYDIKLKVDKIKFLRPDLAMIHTLGAGIEKGKQIPADPSIIMTILAEKKNGTWKIIDFHNHNLETFKNPSRSPIPLNVMYGSWYK